MEQAYGYCRHIFYALTFTITVIAGYPLGLFFIHILRLGSEVTYWLTSKTTGQWAE